MKSFRLAILLGACALGLFCLPVLADSDVLLPSDSSTETPSSGANPTSESNYTPSLPLLDPESASDPSEHTYAPLPASLPDTPNSAEGNPAPAAAQVVEMSQTKPEPKEEEKNLPGSLKVSIAKKYKFGDNDEASVKNKLGIEPKTVDKKCGLLVNGVARTNGAQKIMTFVVTNAAPAELHFDGKLTELTLRANALCDKVPLPETSSYIMQVDDKYSIYVSSINCPAPTDKIQSVELQYDGDGVGECNYK